VQDVAQGFPVPQEKSDPRRRRTLAALGVAVIITIILILTAYYAGWILKSELPKVTAFNVHWQVDGVSDCTATISYWLRNEGNVKAYVDIDYLDNGLVVAHDFYIVQANSERGFEYSIEHVDCAFQHDYDVRIAAVS